MNDNRDTNNIEPRSNALSRRDLIKGVIVGGVAVSSASYLFRASTLLGQSARGTGERLVTINIGGDLGSLWDGDVLSVDEQEQWGSGKEHY